MPFEEFHQLISGYDREKFLKIIEYLLVLCGQELSIQFFLDYAKKIFETYPIETFVSFGASDSAQILGLTRLYAQCGDQLFSKFLIGKEMSAICAIKGVKLCTDCPNIELAKEAFECLSRSQIFTVLIASARIYYPEEFQETKEKVKNSQVYKELSQEPSLSLTNLFTSLFTDKITESTAKIHKQDVIILTNYSLHLFLLDQEVYSYYQPYLSIQYFVYTLKSFILNPSYFKGLALTAFIPHLLFHETSEEIFGVYLRNLDLDLIRKSAHLLFEMDSAPCGLTKDEVLTLLTTCPEVPDSELLEKALSYPSLCTSLGPRVCEAFKIETIDTAAAFATHLLERDDDLVNFIELIMMQDLYLTLVERVFELCQITLQPELFAPLWFFAISVYRFSLTRGIAPLLKEAHKFALDQSGPLGLFLRCMLSNEWQLEEIASIPLIFNETPFLTAMSYFVSLFTANEQEIQEFLEQLRSTPYLWPSALVWGIATTSPSARLLASANLPPYLIAYSLFHHMMVGLSTQQQQWAAAICEPDYIAMLHFLPSTLKEVEFKILQDISVLTKIKTASQKEILQITTSWSAWCIGFGTKDFSKTIISLLMWHAASLEFEELARRAFFSIAYLFVIINISATDLIPDFIETALEFLKGSEEVTHGEGFAYLCLCCLLAIDNYRQPFEAFLDLSIAILKRSKEWTERTTFGWSFIRLSMFYPKLRALMPDSTYECLVAQNDWPTAANFFIAKSLKD